MSKQTFGNEAEAKAANAKAHATRAAEEAAGLAELSYDELRTQLATVKSDLAELTAAMKSMGEAKVREVGAVARQTGRKAVARAEDGYDYAAEQVSEAYSSAERFTRERPAMATAIAAGAGFLLALALSRR